MNFRDRRLHEVLAVMAPPKRFELLLLLIAGGNRSVSQLAEEVGLSQSCTTRHLQALEQVGLVRGLRDGKRVVFRTHATDAAAGTLLASLGMGDAVRGTAEYDARPLTEALPTPSRPAARNRPAPAAVPEVATRRGLTPTAATASDMPAPGSVPSPPVAESAIESAPVLAPVRRRNDLEDFLL